MKKLIFTSFIASLLIINACGNNNSDEIPEDLEGKKTYLADKRSEIRDIQILIEKLEKEISELNPETEKEPIVINTVKIQPQERGTLAYALIAHFLA